jgi:hypothetical protein
MRHLFPSLLAALLGLAVALNGLHAATMETSAVEAVHGTGAPPCDGCAGGGELAGCAAMCAPASGPPSSHCCPIDLSAEARPAPAFHWVERLASPPDPHPPRA